MCIYLCDIFADDFAITYYRGVLKMKCVSGIMPQIVPELNANKHSHRVDGMFLFLNGIIDFANCIHKTIR